MRTFRRFTSALAIVVAAGALAAPVPAFAEYPEKPIRFIVPYGAGGASDIVARIFQKALEDVLPQPVVVINKPGAGGSLGAREAKDAEPDGYTVLSTHIGLHTNRLMGVADFGYEDFEPVAETGTIELVLTASGNSRFENVDDLVAEAKANPDTVTHATNLTSVLHLAALQFMNEPDFTFRFVQVGGGGPRKPHMVGGQSDTSFFSIGEVAQEIENGDLRVLALMSQNRSPFLPDAPTIKEAGYDYDPLGVSFWWMVPNGTPRDRIDFLADSFEQAFAKPDVQKALADRAYAATFVRGEPLANRVRSEFESVKELVERFDISK